MRLTSDAAGICMCELASRRGEGRRLFKILRASTRYVNVNVTLPPPSLLSHRSSLLSLFLCPGCGLRLRSESRRRGLGLGLGALSPWQWSTLELYLCLYCLSLQRTLTGTSDARSLHSEHSEAGHGVEGTPYPPECATQPVPLKLEALSERCRLRPFDSQRATFH